MPVRLVEEGQEKETKTCVSRTSRGGTKKRRNKRKGIKETRLVSGGETRTKKSL